MYKSFAYVEAKRVGHFMASSDRPFHNTGSKREKILIKAIVDFVHFALGTCRRHSSDEKCFHGSTDMRVQVLEGFCMW